MRDLELVRHEAGVNLLLVMAGVDDLHGHEFRERADHFGLECGERGLVLAPADGERAEELVAKEKRMNEAGGRRAGHAQGFASGARAMGVELYFAAHARGFELGGL